MKQELITTNFAEWYDQEKIQPPNYTLKRLDDKRGNRFYYTSEPFQTYAGITSLLSRILPPSYALNEWRKKYGDKADYMLNISAAYGTASHILYKDWLTKREVNQDQMNRCIELCREYGTSEDLPYKDFVCFMKFVEDYQIKPLLCEAMMRCEFNGSWFALTLDLLCEATFKTKETEIIKEEKKKKIVEKVEDGYYKSGKKAGLPKTKNVTRYEIEVKGKEVTKEKNITRLCLVDFKSNFFEKVEKDFYESHLDQLLAAKEAIRQNLGLEVEMLINYSPLGWRTEPNYKVKVWKPEESDFKLWVNLMEQARLRNYFAPAGKIFVQIPITPETKSDEAYRFFSYEDYIKLIEQKSLEELTEEESANGI